MWQIAGRVLQCIDSVPRLQVPVWIGRALNCTSCTSSRWSLSAPATQDGVLVTLDNQLIARSLVTSPRWFLLECSTDPAHFDLLIAWLILKCKEVHFDICCFLIGSEISSVTLPSFVTDRVIRRLFHTFPMGLVNSTPPNWSSLESSHITCEFPQFRHSPHGLGLAICCYPDFLSEDFVSLSDANPNHRGGITRLFDIVNQTCSLKSLCS